MISRKELIATIFSLLVLGGVVALVQGTSNRSEMRPPSGKPLQDLTVEVNVGNFTDVVLKSDKLVLVDFWAPWCRPCLVLAPALKELAVEYEGQLVVAKLDIDQAPELAIQYRIDELPSLKFIRNGEVVAELIDPPTKSIVEEKLKELL